MVNVWVRGGGLTQEKVENVNKKKYGETGVYGMLLYRDVSIGFGCIMRHFIGTHVNCQYPGILAPPSAS